MTDIDVARGDFVDGLADLFATAIQAGVTEEQLRADFEGCLSLQMFVNDDDISDVRLAFDRLKVLEDLYRQNFPNGRLGPPADNSAKD